MCRTALAYLLRIEFCRPTDRAIAAWVATYCAVRDGGVLHGLTVSKIVAYTGFSERAVRGALKRLRDAGVLIRDYKGGHGQRDASKYHFDLMRMRTLRYGLGLPPV